ncbi:MAG TPA: hypothetical protein H9787_10585 [Candidatus Oscillibacter excrementigallinarum]|uniref:Lipoprotein n=1 Tax=Candidatus Oscillibacter excrementigallinarum TaxID=2838716 RepID=A0A9D2RTI6_9FIRM|nr:hypothetical protein [Candidatus Oscillibacter excrementigallinarum]
MKKALIYGLSLALVFALSACADNQGATISQEQKEPINNEETVADPLSDTEKTPATDEQEPYIVSLDDLPLDLLGAFEYGYSTVHTEYPDLSPEEQMEMELDLIRQWCDSFVIAIPDNLNEVYSEWHAQYEATLNAIDEGGSTGSTTGNQSGTVEDITPPSNNNGNTNSSSGNTGNTSKPSGGSSSGNTQSNPSTGSSSSGSNSNGFTPPSDEELEAAFGEAPIEGDDSLPDVGDGSGTTTRDPNDLTGADITISW